MFASTDSAGMTVGVLPNPPIHQDDQMQDAEDPFELRTEPVKEVKALVKPGVLGAGEVLADTGTRVAEEVDIVGQSQEAREKKDAEDV